MNAALTTARLTLRPLGTGDLATMHAIASDAENTRYMMFLPNKTSDETLAFLRSAQSEWEKDAPACFEFAVCVQGKHVGNVSLYLDEERTSAELGWLLSRDAQGQGYATEAARALVAFAVRTLHLRRLTAHCDTRNRPSRRVMEKLGMTRVLEGPRVYEKSGEHAAEYLYTLSLGEREA